MKLLTFPEQVVEYIDMVPLHGSPMRGAGRTTISDVKIICPNKPLTGQEATWYKLKYGSSAEMEVGKKIPALEFPEHNLVLYGVLPHSMEATECWDGKCFTCKVDHYEVIK